MVMTYYIKTKLQPLKDKIKKFDSTFSVEAIDLNHSSQVIIMADQGTNMWILDLQQIITTKLLNEIVDWFLDRDSNTLLYRMSQKFKTAKQINPGG